MKRYSLRRQVLGLVFSLITLRLFPQTLVEQTGITLSGVSNGSVAWGDYDNDGNLDILLMGTTNGSPSGAFSKLYKNNGDNSFTEQTGIDYKHHAPCPVKYGQSGGFVLFHRQATSNE